MKKNSPLKVLVILFIVFAIILIAGIAGKGITVYDVVSTIFINPVRRVGKELYRFGTEIKNIRAYFISKKELLSENEQLEDENRILKVRIKLIQSIYDENIRLRSILQLEEHTEIKSVVADVIGASETPFKFLIINKGNRDGIKKGQPVVITDGAKLYLVGITYEVGYNSAKVLLITDPLFRVGLKDQNTGELGIASGNNTNMKIVFKITEPKIYVDDVLTTTSISSIFPNGIVVGTVEKISKKRDGTKTTILIKPAIDIFHLFQVMVIENEK